MIWQTIILEDELWIIEKEHSIDWIDYFIITRITWDNIWKWDLIKKWLILNNN